VDFAPAGDLSLVASPGRGLGRALWDPAPLPVVPKCNNGAHIPHACFA